MSEFKGRHFEGEIVRWAVRWYCRYGVSYRDLAGCGKSEDFAVLAGVRDRIGSARKVFFSLY